jgi:hypothetical protein
VTACSTPPVGSTRTSRRSKLGRSSWQMGRFHAAADGRCACDLRADVAVNREEGAANPLKRRDFDGRDLGPHIPEHMSPFDRCRRPRPAATCRVVRQLDRLVRPVSHFDDRRSARSTTTSRRWSGCSSQPALPSPILCGPGYLEVVPPRAFGTPALHEPPCAPRVMAVWREMGTMNTTARTVRGASASPYGPRLPNVEAKRPSVA